MNDDDSLISMTSKHSQKCISCSKNISLIEKETYMCSKCKQYFCLECYPMFLNVSKCPGSFNQEEHEPIMVRITRTVKEYAPLGVSIDQLERTKNSQSQSQSSVKIMPDDTTDKEKSNSTKPKLKILDD